MSQQMKAGWQCMLVLLTLIIVQGDVSIALHSKQQDENRQLDIRASLEENKQFALSLLDGAMGSADRLKPVGYSILVQVEGATILWSINQARAISIFKNAFNTLREREKENAESKAPDLPTKMELQQLRFWVLRKMAAVSPELVEELLQQNASGDESKKEVAREWTDEARALMSVAFDQLARDAKLAARLAERSLPLGVGMDWAIFLQRLSQVDSDEAERIAMVYIVWLRDGPFNSIDLLNFANFAARPDASSKLREHFFQSTAVRLRRDIHSNARPGELEDDLGVAQSMSRFAGSFSPRWQLEFGEIASSLEALFRTRSLARSGLPPVKTIDTSAIRASQPTSTQEINEQLASVEQMKDERARDNEYQRLAFQAALGENIGLAESIVSKIKNEETRRATTLKVYGPLVRKALQEMSFSQAQWYALRVQDPLGRMLMLDRVARATLQVGRKEKATAVQIYQIALGRLERESPDEDVAKAFLWAAKSLMHIDSQMSVDAAASAVSVVGQLEKRGATVGKLKLSSGVRNWVPQTNMALKEEEILDLPEMMGAVFSELAKRDEGRVLAVVSGLTHPGLQSLAQVAIARGLLDDAKKMSAASKQ